MSSYKTESCSPKYYFTVQRSHAYLSHNSESPALAGTFFTAEPTEKSKCSVIAYVLLHFFPKILCFGLIVTPKHF